jgi:hypothetical protein
MTNTKQAAVRGLTKDRLQGLLDAFGMASGEGHLEFSPNMQAELIDVILTISAQANDAKAQEDATRLNWLANEVLYCDYGDNNMPGKQIGWGIRASRRNKEPFMYGASIKEAIDAAIQAMQTGSVE